MASSHRGTVLRDIERVFSQGPVAGLAEGQLLQRFVACRDEAAFEALVALHGPMVLGVCRRQLGDSNDVDDAFQATFLVLVQKADSLRGHELLGPWLHGVAFRVATRARVSRVKRQIRERVAATPEVLAATASPADDQAELRGVLDAEIGRLPERYRRPLVLCYLEGQSQAEAAHRLRCTPGTLRGRLDRAREKLRSRLARRGLAPTTAVVTSALAATIPDPLLAATLAAASRTTEGLAGGAATAGAFGLAKHVLRAMLLTKIKWLTPLMAAGAIVLAALPFAGALDESSPPRLPQQAEEPLRNAPGAAVPEVGIIVEGRVLDQDGQPIDAARVAIGADFRKAGYLESITDSQGRFTFHDVKPGDLVLTAQASNHGPDLKRLKLTQAREPIEFRLGPGRTIRGQIFDLKGKPIAGAPVAAGPWRGVQSLLWSATTDAEGRFRWDGAPAGEILVDVGELGYTSKRFYSYAPTVNEHRVEMPRPFYVRGSVTDAKTGRPVETFTLLTGSSGETDGPPRWEYSKARSISNGTYEVKLGAEYRSSVRYLRVEAEGYRPGISRGIMTENEEGDLVVNLKLHRAEWPKGTVRLPDGSPLADAEVVVVTPPGAAYITNGRPPKYPEYRILKTDAGGRFAFAPPTPPYTLVVLHDRGFVARNSDQFAASPNLTIEPWGRIEGTLRVGNRPGAGLDLHGSTDFWRRTFEGRPLVQHDNKAVADGEGRFTFDRVIPGAMAVSRVFKQKIGDETGTVTWSFSSQTEVVEVRSGELTRVVLGGRGRPVVGHVVAPPGIVGQLNWTYNANALCGKPDKIDVPPGLNAEAKQQWFEQWKKSAKGQEYLRIQQIREPVMIEPDGSFRVEDVEAGTYVLDINLSAPPADPERNSTGSSLLGSAHRELTIPEMSGGRSDQPFDLGTIVLKPFRERKVDADAGLAPAFQAETLDGKPLSLNDFKGRYVLLNFWATWSSPCLAETPHLKAAFEAFGKDARFTIISLSLDSTKDEARKFAAEHGLAWTQGYLGNWTQAKLPERFGVWGIPSIWLIGPDGKVIAKDLRGDAIEKAVAVALDGRPGARP